MKIIRPVEIQLEGQEELTAVGIYYPGRITMHGYGVGEDLGTTPWSISMPIEVAKVLVKKLQVALDEAATLVPLALDRDERDQT